MQKKSKIPLLEYKQGVILSDANYNLFYSFLNSTNKSLKILCWRINEKLLSEFLWFLKDKEISIEIITKNRTEQGYLNEFKKYCSKLEINSRHRTKIHAKLIVKDDTSLIVGSSNFTEWSMSETEHFLDCNIVTSHEPTIQSAIDLFRSIYDDKDYTKRIKDTKLMYSRYHKDDLPLSLKPYFEQEKEEIILLFSCNQVDKRIVERIIGWNSSTPIKLYVSDYWASEISNENLVSIKWLYENSINNNKNVTVIPIKSNVHSKLYLFKGQETIFVSSQNLTVNSWQSLLETGILSNDKSDIRDILDSIKSFKKSQLAKIEDIDLEETSKPESLFSGDLYERSIGLPWELLESDSEWKIQKTRNLVYFKLTKERPSKNKSELSQFQGSRDKSKETIKHQLLQELKSLHLAKQQSTTGLYSSPTRYILTGKLSKRKEIRIKEAELELYKKLITVASDEKEMKRFQEAIDWKEKELTKYN